MPTRAHASEAPRVKRLKEPEMQTMEGVSRRDSIAVQAGLGRSLCTGAGRTRGRAGLLFGEDGAA